MIHIENHMSADAFCQYAVSQKRILSQDINGLESDWDHSSYVRVLLEETELELKQLIESVDWKQPNVSAGIHERKIEKYTTWVEVLRLASFQYGRYSNQHSSLSEGLYSTLLALSSQYCHNMNDKTISVLGCGPGRTVLDFALAYPLTTVVGMDYSLLSLVVAKHILGDSERRLSIPIRDTTGESYSELVTIPKFSLNNCKLFLCDLTEPQKLCVDLIVCSNTINLLPDHDRAIGIISDMLLPGGIIIFADLTGWRLDRNSKQSVLRSNKSIKECFAKHGIDCIEMFRGGPYIEQETRENYTLYYEHFFVGRKDLRK